VGRSEVFGAGQYACGSGIKPDQLAKLGNHRNGHYYAIQAQSKVNPAGQVGGEPASGNQQYTMRSYTGPSDISRKNSQHRCSRSSNGGIVRVKDVERVELGQQDYSTISRLNGKPSAIIAILPASGI